MKLKFKIIFIVFNFFGINSCSKKQIFRQQYKDANSLLNSTSNLEHSPFLKAHLKNGEVWIFDENWRIDTLNNVVYGWGTIYSFNRSTIQTSSDLKLLNLLKFSNVEKK